MGLSQSLMEDLLLRRAVLEGRTPMTTLADRLHISINVVEALLNEMRQRKLIEYDGMEGRAYLISVTEAGRALSTQRSQESRYAGPMPVSLESYKEVVAAQRPMLQLNRDMLARSFSDLVIAPDLFDQLGPAIHGSGAIFLYGPPGTGKSSVAERVVRAYEDTVLIPYCIEVDGQIVALFDPTLHELVENSPPGRTNAGCGAVGLQSSPAESSTPACWTSSSTGTPGCTSLRCSCGPTTVCWSSTTSAGRR